MIPDPGQASKEIIINLNDSTLCQVVKKEKDIRWLRTSVRKEEEQIATRKSSVITTFFI
ncbi:hypothetical protein GFO_3574 [Christiangramia forsetii KT0803]|uniref:Uncharacterized protein n=1 Tax=Christiangramia forsetii (strain DSM 17595 / CGMCC 1.15422 / KT0803) TaxID=411154 RepID=A0M7B7_CHRFK|nr:hypothetical protein GFO_3574 [Christiangramia forsetii KT0803]